MNTNILKKNTPRAQTTHPASFGLVLALCASHLPLCGVFRRVQPI